MGFGEILDFAALNLKCVCVNIFVFVNQLLIYAEDNSVIKLILHIEFINQFIRACADLVQFLFVLGCFRLSVGLYLFC